MQARRRSGAGGRGDRGAVRAGLGGTLRPPHRRHLRAAGRVVRRDGVTVLGDGPRGAVVVVEDRSLQKRIETVRRDFVANISHELKTPIGALGLLAETIRDEPDHEVVGRLAERMIVEADRVSRTVDDLLELSRIEFGDDAEFERLAIVAVVAEAEGRINSAADQAGIKIARRRPVGPRDRRRPASARLRHVQPPRQRGEVLTRGLRGRHRGRGGPRRADRPVGHRRRDRRSPT